MSSPRLKLAALTVGVLMTTPVVMVATASPASAHQGNIQVLNAVCVDKDTVDITYQVSWANVPANAQNTVIGSRTGTTTFNSAWDDSPAAASAWANVNRGAVGSAAGNRSWTVTLEKSQFGGTNSANGPWEYAHFPWTNGNTGSRYHDTRVEGFDWSKCKTTVTPASFTVTPATCTSNGSVSIPAQPAGVLVAVNGNQVTPPWTTSTPGTYNIAYSAASGYVLSNNPSGTVVVQQQLGIENCQPPPPPYTCPSGTVWVDADGDGVVDEGECDEPKKVRAAVDSTDKCGRSADAFFADKARGVKYLVKGKIIREGVWLKAKTLTVKVKAKAASDKFKLVGKKVWVLKFTDKPCPTPPHNPPPTGERK